MQDAVHIRITGEKEAARNESPSRQLTWGAGRLAVAGGNAMRRREPRWSTGGAAEAIPRFLDEISGYVHGDDAPWGADVRRTMIEVAPGFVEPIATLEGTRKEMLEKGDLWHHHEAAALAERALGAASEISRLVELHYRPVPSEAVLPLLGLRWTTTSRAHALLAAVERSDAQIEAWYGFFFSSPSPAQRNLQIADIARQTRAVAEATDYEEKCLRCRDLAATDNPAWSISREGVNQLRATLRGFEQAAYNSLLSSPETA